MKKNIIKNAIVGIDEVGRGCIAGPLVAAAVILPKNHNLVLKDSKKLSHNQRLRFAEKIKAIAIEYKIKEVSASKIDVINIHQSTLKVMKKVIYSLDNLAPKILIDGIFSPDLRKLCDLGIEIKTIIKGDNLHPEIQAAAILAKVYRDNLMNDLHLQYPNYQFNQHKGYPTKIHKQAISQFQPIQSVHRFSFAPLKDIPHSI